MCYGLRASVFEEFLALGDFHKNGPRKAREAARARDRQTTAASQNEAVESDEPGEETAGERTTRVGRTRGGMKVAARIGEKLRREIGSGRRPRVGDG